MLLFSVLYTFWIANLVAFNGNVALELQRNFWRYPRANYEAPQMIAHRLMGMSFMHTARWQRAEASDRAILLYDPASIARLRRDLATTWVSMSFRSLALWLLGYPEAALKDADEAVKRARNWSAATSVYALVVTPLALLHCGNYRAADAPNRRSHSLAAEKALCFGRRGVCLRRLRAHPERRRLGCRRRSAPESPDCGQRDPPFYLPVDLTYLARALGMIGQFNDARRCIGEAMAAVKNNWRNGSRPNSPGGGEIALLRREDAAKAEKHFERASGSLINNKPNLGNSAPP